MGISVERTGLQRQRPAHGPRPLCGLRCRRADRAGRVDVVSHAPSRSDASIWVIGAAIAFASAVIVKYGYAANVLPLLGLLVSVRGVKRSWRALGMFLSVVGVILTAYFGLIFESLFPPSSAAYLDQTFGEVAATSQRFRLSSGWRPSRWRVQGRSWHGDDASDCWR